MGLFSGIIGGIIGWYIGGPWGARIGFYLGYEASTEGGLFDVYQEDILESALGMDYDLDRSLTYGHPNIVGNTISEDIPVARCYGKCKIGANKLRFNEPTDSDLRIIFAHCMGEVNGITEWKVNNIAWGDLTGSHTKSEYKGTRTQTADARFSSRACAYRGIAYTAATFTKNDKQIGHDPRMTVVMEGLKCAPLAGGADAFTRNNAVIIYDWYLNVEGYSAGDLDLNAFKSLEALCDAVPSGGSIARYRFDFNFDANQAINDAKKLLWGSFNGRIVMSQGKLKPVWDSGQMADGAGGLTAKTVSHAFDEDNIARGSLSWWQPPKYNIVRIHYLDATKDYKKTSVEEKNEHDIDQNGEILYEENCYYITDSEIARRRAKLKFNKFKYTDYAAQLSAFSGAGDLELYDLVTVTHTLPGWSAKKFLITGKSEDQYGRMKFILAAYYSGIYDDAEASDQTSYESDLPNPFDPPGANTGIGLALVSPGTGYDYDAVKVTFTPPDDPFYAYTEIYVSNDDSTYYLAGTSSGEDFVIQGMGMFYVPGDTCYVKLKNVNEMGVFSSLSAAESIVITSSIRLGSFYAGLYDFWGGNAAIGNAATTIVLGNLDGTVKVALGPSADAISVAGTVKGFIADGTGKVYFGDGANKYFKFDGINISWKAANAELDAAGNITLAGGTIGGWTIGATKISITGIELDQANNRIRAYTGANYVDMTAAGLTGYDSVLGTTFKLPTDGSAPEFSSGIIKECVYEIYTSGVIRTNANPSANGGLIINNTDLKGYTSAGLKVLQLVYDGTDEGDAYIGDYDNTNPGLKYDHSAGILNYRGSIIITGGSGIANLTDAGALATGDSLDDVADGSSYGRVALTAISAGKIVLTSAGVTGTLPTSLSVAKCTDPNADQTSAHGQNLGWLIGSTGTLTISASGKIIINTADALEITAAGNIKVLAGGDIEMTLSDTNPSLIKWGAKVYEGIASTDARGLCIWPETAKGPYFHIGYDPVNNTNKYMGNINFYGSGYCRYRSYYDANNYGGIYLNSTATTGRVDLQLRYGGTSRNIFFRNSDMCFSISSHKEFDFGLAASAWDDAYADDWHNVADFYYLDDYSDLKAILDIRPSGIIDKRTGLPLIDDNSIPEWLLTRHKKDTPIINEHNKIIGIHKKGEIARDPEGKPYLSTKIMLSLLMGAVKQLDQKIINLEKR